MTTPDVSESWIDPIFNAIVSDAQSSGYFEVVNQYEPKAAPCVGLSAAIWLQSITPIPLASGLASTSGRLVFMLRIYSNLMKEPSDLIDPNMARAASNLMRRYHDDFDFGGVIRNVDLLGAFGIPLDCNAGYLPVDDATFRIIDLQIPCIVNDIWPQVS